MPLYMFQGGYTAETWARLAQTPEDREAAVRAFTERNGGKLIGLWFAFGAEDFVAVAELPDNITAGAIAAAVAGAGGYRDFRATPLLTAQEAMEIMGYPLKAGHRMP